MIHNVELKPGKGGQLARSARTYVQLVGRDRGHAILHLASGEVRLVRSECMASLGAYQTLISKTSKLAKLAGTAGLSAACARCCLNPIDHPHGGGEGQPVVGIL